MEQVQEEAFGPVREKADNHLLLSYDANRICPESTDARHRLHVRSLVSHGQIYKSVKVQYHSRTGEKAVLGFHVRPLPPSTRNIALLRAVTDLGSSGRLIHRKRPVTEERITLGSRSKKGGGGRSTHVLG